MKKAELAQKNAYAPYTSFPVGAAVFTRRKKIFIGCNIENVAFSSGVCAEQSAISSAFANGCKNITHIAICCRTKDVCFPCLARF